MNSFVRRSRAFKSTGRRKKDPTVDPGWSNEHHGVVRHYRTDVASGSHSEAVLSACGRYRYLLKRWWEHGGSAVLWVMLNPSTADGTRDDHTIRRCVGFSRKWGFDGLLVANLFAWRSTDPRGLALSPDPVGELRDEYLSRAVARADEVVVAWGARGSVVEGARAFDLIARAGRSPRCLGVTRDGHPLHPLRLPYSARRRAWRPAR